MGAVLMVQGKAREAIVHLERALALKPDLFEACANLAQSYLAVGELDPAIRAAGRALELKETAQGKSLFVQCVKSARFNVRNDRIRKFVLRALSEGWAPPRELTGTCISLIKLNSVANEVSARSKTAWPARLAVSELLGTAGLTILSRDQLLCCLLKLDPVSDIDLERLLTNARHAMLTICTTERNWDETLLDFFCAVARQCFINQYVFSMTDDEVAAAERMRASLELALAAGGDCGVLLPVVVGAYFPLHALTSAKLLLDRSWPESVEALLVQQVREPLQERQIAATIPILTRLDGEVAALVRQQYEEDPYPRWLKATPLEPSAAEHTARPIQNFDVLIAGCGTGLSAVEFAQQARGARILAIDLSRASLSYAVRMAQKFGLTNIEFGQADIMNLATIGRKFDLIDASGVLHHLADPWAGWRVLLSLLRPGGSMQVGLYSETARRNVVAARALIAERGYKPVPHDIRRCRDDIAASDDALLKSLTQGQDFYATSECRDLLFHVQERRITLPEIQSFVAVNNLKFAGFIVDAATVQRFVARFPEPAALTDLDRWHAFETEAPGTFVAMYQFQVQKPSLGLG